MKYILVFSLLFMIIGCTNKNNHFSHTEKENISLFACAKNNNTVSVIDKLYAEMVECIKKGNSEHAIFSFSLAGTLTWYYASKDSSSENKQMHQKSLAKALALMSEREKQVFWTNLQEKLSNETELTNICNEIDSAKYQVINNDVDVNLWSSSMNGYLHCKIVTD